MNKNGWTHSAQLTNGGVFASTSPAKRARRAAYGLVAVIFQLYSGGRGAELFGGSGGILPWCLPVVQKFPSGLWP